MTEEQIQRVQKAQAELTSALGDLRRSLPPTAQKPARALSIAITEAETSYLWFRSAVSDYDAEGNPR